MVMAPLRVLLIEDSDDDAALLSRALARAGYEVATHQVDTAEQLDEALDTHTFDIAIADHRMPLFSGTRALDMIRTRGLDLPFMFVSGTIGEEVAIQAMNEGACDYIVKGDLSRLPAVVERELHDAARRREQRLSDEGNNDA